MSPFDPSSALAEIDAKISAETKRSERLMLAILRKGYARVGRLQYERSQILAAMSLVKNLDCHAARDVTGNTTGGSEEPVSIAVALIDILYDAGPKGLSGKELRAKAVEASRRPVDSVARAISRTRTRGDIDRGTDLRWRITTAGREGREGASDPV